jgi:hypothetical protein
MTIDTTDEADIEQAPAADIRTRTIGWPVVIDSVTCAAIAGTPGSHVGPVGCLADYTESAWVRVRQKID